jgi:hypothetical protein
MKRKYNEAFVLETYRPKQNPLIRLLYKKRVDKCIELLEMVELKSKI